MGKLLLACVLMFGLGVSNADAQLTQTRWYEPQVKTSKTKKGVRVLYSWQFDRVERSTLRILVDVNRDFKAIPEPMFIWSFRTRSGTVHKSAKRMQLLTDDNEKFEVKCAWFRDKKKRRQHLWTEHLYCTVGFSALFKLRGAGEVHIRVSTVKGKFTRKAHDQFDKFILLYGQAARSELKRQKRVSARKPKAPNKSVTITNSPDK